MQNTLTRQRLILPPRMLGHIALAFCLAASLAQIAYFADGGSSQGAYHLAPIMLTCAIALFGVATGLAYRGQTVCPFALATVGICVIQLNGAVVSGFGLYSPALYTGLIPVALAFALFGRQRAVLYSLPTVAVWALVFALDRASLIRQDTLLAKPSAVNVALTLLTVFATVFAVLYLYAQRAESAILDADADQRSQSEELRRQQQLRVEREAFMGQLSHEIRTPIAALRNAVALLNHPKATEEVRARSLRLIDTTSGNLLALLNDALDSFRFGSQQFTVRHEMFDIVELLDEIHALFAVPAETKGLSLWIDLSGVRHPVVTGDAMRLRQMLSNLVGNAVKFTHAGEVRVRVIEPFDRAGTGWRFEVKDTGRGLSTDQQQSLFKPFSQVEGNPKKEAHGTGLGLSIVAQLAQAMGGRAGVVSAVGQGSTFWFEVAMQVPEVTSGAAA